MKTEKRRFGDRCNARRIRDIDGVHSYMAYLMPKRTEAEVYIYEELDVTDLLAFLEEKNSRDADYKTTMFHAMVTAVAKTVRARPLLNRYVSGRKYYMRQNITLGFIAKKRFEDHAEEAVMILKTQDEDMLDTISRRIVGEVHVAREETEQYGADKILDVLAKLPRCLMQLFMSLIRVIDFYGKMPRSLTDVDTNYCSVLLSNLGSIRCDAAYHHLNNFGTNSIVITIGEIRKAPQVAPDGSLVARDIMAVGMTADERIADGFYFAKSLKLIKHLLANPALLNTPLKEEVSYEC